MTSENPQTIHKYNLTPGTCEIRTRDQARFLHVDTQDGTPVLWAEVDTDKNEVTRRIDLAPTGGVVPRNGVYLGTAVGVAGVFVFHAYLLPE